MGTGGQFKEFGVYVQETIETLQVPSPPLPTKPVPVVMRDPTTGKKTTTPVNAVDEKVYQDECTLVAKERWAIRAYIQQAYNLIWGQCSDALRSKMASRDGYTKMYKDKGYN